MVSLAEQVRVVARARVKARTSSATLWPATPNDLNTWIASVTGHHIPALSVCPGHDAPLDFVWAFFSNQIAEALVLANRAGGKCMSPQTRILMGDLTWRALADVRTGDAIIAFDEEPLNGKQRRLQAARVLAAWPARKQMVEIEFANGLIVHCSVDHPFLTRNAGQRRQYWQAALENRRSGPGKQGLHSAIAVLPTWEVDESREAGWLAGFYDGEGTYHHGNRQVTVTQNEGVELDRAIAALRARGFEFFIGQATGPTCRRLVIKGGDAEAWRFLGTVRPGRLLRNFTINAISRVMYGTSLPVMRVTPIGEGDVISITTDTRTYIAEGLAVHNTFDVAALHLANAYFKPGHETSHIGAIEIQAKRCYSYYTAGLRSQLLREAAPDPHIRDTLWRNGSRIEILPGTEAQTQGGHPHIATYDELEQGKRQPYENAKSMPVEWTDSNGKRQRGQFLATSTRQTSLGLMQRALDEAAEHNTTVFTWCVLETIEPCDGQDGRPACDYQTCPLWQWCEGRAQNADGWRSRDEIIGMYNRVGRDTWEAQHLCIKPDAKALIYAPFGRDNISDDADYVPGAGPVWVSYDWGYTDPSHICFVQQRGECYYCFDELVGSNRSEREWVEAIVRRVVDLPDYEGPDVDGWAKIWQNNEWPNRWPQCWPESVGDPSAVQMRAELKAHGINAARAALVKHEVEQGQDVLRAAILSGADLRRLFIHPRCVQTIRALSNYRARELADGSFDPRPDPDPANHAFSHGCDSLRYLFWRLRRALGIIIPQEGANEPAHD